MQTPLTSPAQIATYLQEHGLMAQPQVTLLGEGYSNQNYLATDGENSFVCRIRKSNEAQFADALARENTAYRFFTAQGLDFCPQVIHFDEQNHILIISFLPGRLTKLTDLTHEQLDTFARQLYAIHALNIDTFEAFCAEHSLPTLPRVSKQESLQMYGFERFKHVQEQVVGKEVYAWINSRLSKAKTYVEHIPSDENMNIVWFDVQSEVMIDGDSVSFFDFEFVHIASSNELTYIKETKQLSDQQFKYLVSCYSSYSNQKLADLRKNIINTIPVARLLEVIWAAMKWSETGDTHFKDLTYERIERAENSQ